MVENILNGNLHYIIMEKKWFNGYSDFTRLLFCDILEVSSHWRDILMAYIIIYAKWFPKCPLHLLSSPGPL